jgi:glycosyltransferase involved in cell wall biosynthesis
MKVALLTGSYPPDICGVADYTEQLYLNLSRCDIDVVIFNTKTLGWLGVYNKLLTEKIDVLHMQYPTIGYGWSLLPQILMLLYRGNKVITLHEFKERHFLRRFFMRLFKYCFKTRFVFTNEFEAKIFFPNTKNYVIPIGSNIPKSENLNTARMTNSIVNFGLIRPDRGIESFLEFASKNPDYKFYLVGKVDERFSDYFKKINDLCLNYNVEVLLGLSSVEVSNFLSTIKYAYLPFPDGASDRRGSLIAAMLNGCIVITKIGSYTNDELKKCVISIDDHLKLDVLLDDDFEYYVSLSKKYVTRFDWDNISRKHIELYKDLIKND